MAPSSAIVWDFDGTLAERRGMWSQCLADLASERLGRLYSREQFVPFLRSGFPWHTPEISHTHLNSAEEWWNALEPLLMSAFVGATHVDGEAARALAAQVRDRYTDAVSWTVYPDTKAALDSLSRSGWVHVLLSNHVPELPSLVAALGLAGHFSAILSSANLGYEKPRTECFAAAVSHLPNVKRVVVIGDSHSADMVGANAAGFEGILVRTRPHGPYKSFENLELLVQHLDAS
jgi:putative hydrolase of the HAD superfamily